MPRHVETLRRLAGFRAENGLVLSLYLDLDPSRLPNAGARHTAVEGLLSEAGKRFGPSLDRHRSRDLTADIERVRSYFADEFSPKGVRSVAVFSSASENLFEALRLSGPVESTVVVDESAYVEPLTGLLPSDDWCVFLVNRRTARILVGTRDQLEERTVVTDNVPGQHDTGGRSQARYERHVDKAAQDHVKHACEVLFRLYKRSGFDRLLVGCTEELMPEVESHLHSYLGRRLAGRVDVDVENTSAEEVLHAARPAMEADERDREDTVLARLGDGMGRGDGAVAGAEAVLEALRQRRVGALVLRPNTDIAGVGCPACGWVGVSGDACPADGTPTEPRADVTETLIELALGQSADVVVLRHHPRELERHGGVAALLRY